jgi:hypothetical protein
VLGPGRWRPELGTIQPNGTGSSPRPRALSGHQRPPLPRRNPASRRGCAGRPAGDGGRPWPGRAAASCRPSPTGPLPRPAAGSTSGAGSPSPASGAMGRTPGHRDGADGPCCGPAAAAAREDGGRSGLAARAQTGRRARGRALAPPLPNGDLLPSHGPAGGRALGDARALRGGGRAAGPYPRAPKWGRWPLLWSGRAAAREGRGQPGGGGPGPDRSAEPDRAAGAPPGAGPRPYRPGAGPVPPGASVGGCGLGVSGIGAPRVWGGWG